MGEFIKYEYMNKDELKIELARLSDDLDETTEERDMMLGQSGHHVPSTKYFRKYQAEIEKINNAIAAVNQCLRQRGATEKR